MRDRALLELLYGTGARISELMVLDLDDTFLDVTRVQRGGVDVPLASVTHASDVLRVPLSPPLLAGAPATAAPSVRNNCRAMTLLLNLLMSCTA